MELNGATLKKMEEAVGLPCCGLYLFIATLIIDPKLFNVHYCMCGLVCIFKEYVKKNIIYILPKPS